MNAGKLAADSADFFNAAPEFAGKFVHAHHPGGDGACILDHLLMS